MNSKKGARDRSFLLLILFCLSMLRSDICNYLGLTVETVSRILRDSKNADGKEVMIIGAAQFDEWD